VFVTKFKLQLASYEDGRLSAKALPDKLPTETIITDYLREIFQFINETSEKSIWRAL